MSQYNSSELYHFGVPGMRWGHRKAPATLTSTGKVSSTTKKVIDDYNSMNEQQFKNKYYTSKQTYAKRVEKYGDPYMNSPLAKFGKQLNKNAEKRDNQILNKQAKKGELNSQYSKQDRLLDQQMYGTRSVRNISKRMDKGQSHKRATNVESGKQFLQGTVITALTLDALSGGELHKAAINAGKKFVASEAARKAVVKIAQNPKFDPIDVAYKILD